MPKPRLIFINRFFAPDHSATAQILADLTSHLSSRGWRVHVISSRSLYSDPSRVLPSHERIGDVTVTRVWTSRFGRASLLGRAFDYFSFYPTMALTLWRIARAGDIIIAKTDPPLLSVVAAPVARLRRSKLINWLQDLYPEVAAELGMTFLKGSLGRAIASMRNASLRAAEANVAIGDRMAARLRALGLNEHEVVTLPNWSDDMAIKPQPLDGDGLRASWGIAADAFVVGYSGNLGQAHEVETLLEAASLLRHQPAIRFLFVGGGRYTEHLKIRVAEAGLKSFVFQPYQPREQLAQSLAVANVHWISLRPAMEGLIVPSKVYGVAAAGRPVIAIASAKGELGALVQRYKIGFVVEPGKGGALANAILKLHDNQAVAEAMGHAARRMLEENFSKATTLCRWEGFLTRVATD